MDFPAVARWRKSSRSNPAANDCVEVAVAGAVVGVRDSKNAAGPVILLNPAGWEAFRAAVTQG